jgi:tape measure domain-containing protein
MSEVVDIIVKESGSAEGAAGIRAIGEAATITQAQLDSMLLQLGALGPAMGAMTAAVSGNTAALNQAAGATQNHAHAMKDHANAAHEGREAAVQFKEAMVALGLALEIKEWVELTDVWTVAANQLRLVSGSAHELEDAQHALFDVSQETYSSFAANVDLYSKMARATQGLGLDQKQLVDVVKVIDQAFLAEGKSSDQAAQGVRSLAFAFATGNLNGRVIMSLFKEMPVLTEQLAKSFFTGADAQVRFYNALKSGDITTKQLLEHMADLGLKTSDFQKIMKLIEPTVANAWQMMKTSVLQYFGAADATSRQSETLAHIMMFLAQNMNTIIPIVAGLSLAITLVTARAIAASAAMGLFLTPFGLIALAIGGLIALFMRFGDTTFTVFGQTTTAATILSNVIHLLWDFVANTNGWTQAAIAILGVVAAVRVFMGINLLAFLVPVTIAMYNLAAATLAAIGPWGLLAIAVGAVIALIAYATGNLDGFINKMKQVGGVLVTEGKKKIEETAGSLGLLEKGARGAGDGLDKLKKSTDDLGGSMDSLKGSVDNDTSGFDAFIKKQQQLADVQNRLAESVGSSLKLAVDQYGRFYLQTQKTKQGLNDQVDALGRTIDKTKELENTTHEATDNMTQWYDTWTTQAEHDLDTLIHQQDAAAAAARQQQSASGGGGGGGGAGGAFSFAPTNASYNYINGGGARTLQEYGVDVNRLNQFGAENTARNNNGMGMSPQMLAFLRGLNPDAQAILKASGWAFAKGGSFTVGGNGGTDSQMVKFLASPGERVTVQTPDQQRAGVTVNMTVIANDAASFQRTQRQIATSLKSQIQRAG